MTIDCGGCRKRKKKVGNFLCILSLGRVITLSLHIKRALSLFATSLNCYSSLARRGICLWSRTESWKCLTWVLQIAFMLGVSTDPDCCWSLFLKWFAAYSFMVYCFRETWIDDWLKSDMLLWYHFSYLNEVKYNLKKGRIMFFILEFRPTWWIRT